MHWLLHHSFIKFVFLFDLIAIFPGHAQVESLQTIYDEAPLDFIIESGISAERGHLVDLDEPRLQLAVQHHVEAQDLETKLVLYVLGLATPNEMPDVRLNHTNALQNYIVDVLLNSQTFNHAVICLDVV